MGLACWEEDIELFVGSWGWIGVLRCLLLQRLVVLVFVGRRQGYLGPLFAVVVVVLGHLPLDMVGKVVVPANVM